MSIVFLDSTAPKGQVRIANTETQESVLVTKDRASIAEATKALKEAKPS